MNNTDSGYIGFGVFIGIIAMLILAITFFIGKLSGEKFIISDCINFGSFISSATDKRYECKPL